MPAQIGYFDTLKSVAGKVFTYLASITLTGTDGKTITVTQDTALDEAVAMSSKAPKASPVFTETLTAQAATLTPGTTIITNGDMELDANWASEGTPTVNERSTTQVHTLTYSRKFTVDAASEGIRQTGISLTGGHVYKATVWIYGDGSNSADMYFYSAAGGTYYKSGGANAVIYPASWTKVEWMFLVSASAADFKFAIISGPGMTGGTWYVDDVSLTEFPLTVSGDMYLTGNARVVIPTFANNAAAIAGGLLPGQFYRVNAATDPEPLYIVH